MLISLRIPNALIAELDAIAKSERRSRNQVILMRLENPIMEVRRLLPIDLAKTLIGPGVSIPCEDPRNLKREEVMQEVDRRAKAVKPHKSERAASFKPGEKCPHGWMNAYSCTDGCNS